MATRKPTGRDARHSARERHEDRVAGATRPGGARRILLTGRPGVGKTTVVRRVLDLLAADEAGADRGAGSDASAPAWVVEGFFTEEMRDSGGSRTGFRIRTLRGGSGVLATVGLRSSVHVGRYGVDLESIDAVVNSMLEEVLADSAVDLLVLDEIGKMESASQRFRELVDRAFASGVRILATVPLRGSAWIAGLERRADAVVVEVTRGNRDDLPAQIVDALVGGGTAPPAATNESSTAALDREAPLDRVEEFDVVRVEDGASGALGVPVAPEVAFTVLANREEIATLMCTPGDLEEFCYGFLFTSGIISAAEEVISCRCDTTRWVGHVEVRDLPDLSLLGKRIQTPGCGKGVVYASAVEMASRLPISSALRVSQGAVIAMVRGLEASSEIHRRTGGVHSAALADTSGALGRVFDDIGRHNAVDKVIGDGLRSGVDFSTRILVSSGRVSSEILHKAKRCDLSVVVSRSAPTHQSVLRAREMGVTLIGFARGRKFTVYSHADRITD